MDLILTLLLGVFLGAAVAALLLRSTYAARCASLSTQRDMLDARVQQLSLAGEHDDRTAQLLGPLGEALVRVERQVGVLERDRIEQWGELGERLDAVGSVTARLQQETASLAGALKSSNVSGTWGETGLRRILEHSGMLARCDFEEQVSVHVREGGTLRPDVVVRLPGERTLIIDSKAPLTAFLGAARDGITDAERAATLSAHARALRGHLDALSAKAYWAAFRETPEMVVAFVPSDAVLSAALLADPTLFERAISRKVVLASPSTLLALLRTIAFSWQQDSLSANAKELLELGSTLYARLATLGQHADKLGASLRKSVEAYNSLLGTLESRVLVTARKMHELGVADRPADTTEPITAAPRPLSARELIDAIDDDVARPQLDLRVGRSASRDSFRGDDQCSEPAS
ncbi:MAG: DNA recombination protein RmuC [Allobranchiibius sp.]